MGDYDADVCERVWDVQFGHECFDGVNCVERYPAYHKEKDYNCQISSCLDFSLLGGSEDS